MTVEMEKKVRRYFFSVYVQDVFAIPLARLLIARNVKANYVTLVGLFSAIGSGISYLNQDYLSGSLLFFFALILDSTDGRVARGTNTFSDFGAKLDAVADKVRSFFVAFCFIVSLELDVEYSFALFAYYLILPISRLLMSRREEKFYDPTILFWDATPFRTWLVNNGVWGFYNGWERSVLALCIAPLTPYALEFFLLSVVIEQLLFVIGFLFCKHAKVGW